MSKKRIQNNSLEYNSILKNIYSGDFEFLSSNLDSIANINETDCNGDTLLKHAVVYHRHRLVKFLLDKGANPDIIGKDLFPPIHASIQSGDLFMTQMLCDAGANLNITDRFGNNALFRALFSHCRWSHHLIAYLLEIGVDPNHKNNSGISANDVADSIANYDYAPLFSIPDDYRNMMFRVVLTSEQVLHGAPIQYVYLYAPDRVWEFQSEIHPAPKDIRVVEFSKLDNLFSNHLEIMSSIHLNQYAYRLSPYSSHWVIDNIDLFSCYSGAVI
ncbi:MAG: ankyrin repeat domain-containing protein [Bacteroidales bacterium]|nr:ankyrin repeat domain-containing protein [Bacteroidales bacterium]